MNKNRKWILAILLFSITLGCLQGNESQEDGEVLVDSARFNVDASLNHVKHGNSGEALNSILDAQSDLEASLSILNGSVRGDETGGIKKARKALEGAFNSIRAGDLEGSLSHLGVAQNELLRVAIIFLSRNELAPKKYSVVIEEIPITYYGYVEEEYIGYQVATHNVASIAREAFYYHDKTANKAYLKKALFLTEYLISTADIRADGDFIVWENDFKWPPYNLSKGWIGSLSQAGCVKTLMLAHEATGEGRYKDIAQKALLAFDVDIADGGLKTLRTDGKETYVWYPEYSSPDPPFVLNGFITTVIWIGEYHQRTGDQHAKDLYEDGLKSIIRFLPDYRYGEKGSYYDAQNHVSNNHYHELHVKQMEILYDQTENEIFKNYNENWGDELSKTS